jgi:hypothetical protein
MLWMLLAGGLALQAGAADAPATALELAIGEQRCNSAPPTPAAAASSESHDDCVTTQVAALRADFGRDLSRLAPADRRAIDGVCSKIDRTVMREAYVKCLSDQLTAVHARRSKNTAADAAPAAAPQDSAATALPLAPVPRPPSGLPMMWIGAGALAVFVIGGAAFVMLRRPRAASHKCHKCGQDVQSAGDLCPQCRHEAAEAARTAAHERAAAERAQEDQQKRLREHEEEQARARVEAEAEAHRQREEQARLEEERRHEAAAAAAERQREEASHPRTPIAAPESAPAEDPSSPYAILDVPRDASADAIKAAYEEAKAKYAPDLVDGMSSEIQEHFARKLAAVERAYQEITEGARG